MIEPKTTSAGLDGDLLVLLSDVARHLGTYGDRLAKAHGITRAQLIILARLARESDLSQCELASIAEVSPVTIARLIDRLEALGLVERCADGADRRIWRLRLTSKAAPLQRDINRLRARLHAVATEGIAPAALDAMARGLRRMKENVINRRPGDASS
jgi:MarR family transcriptional regulator, transcriptional regulator for hemolysin